MTIFVLLYIAFLLKFSDIDRYWLRFAAILCVMAQAGFPLRMGWLLVAIVIAKVLKDVYRPSWEE